MTKFQKICLAFIVIVWFILTAAFSAKIGNKSGYKKGYADALASIKPDTVTVIDTIREEIPVEVVKWKDKEKPVYIAIHDTTTVHDSTYIVLPREIKQYKSDAYSLQISGIEPTLDWIETYNKTEYITKVVPEYKYPTFALSPSVGGFIFPNEYGVGAGLELDYWLNRWEVSGGGGYYISNNSKGVYGEISVKYNLVRK